MKNFSVKGYTLVELLVAILIIAAISVISVNILWDSLTTRSKAYAIERSSDNFRQFIQTLTNSIYEAKAINIPSSGVIEISGDPCMTLSFNSGGNYIEGLSDLSTNCTPPTSGFERMTDESIIVARFDTQPVGNLPTDVNVEITGVYKDSLGEHPFEYKTTIHPRVSQ